MTEVVDSAGWSRTALAWAAHAYTALGLVLAGFIAVLIVRGGAADLRAAFLLFWLAMAIDSTDGWLARRARVTEVLPAFDGRRLDDLVDFQTYTVLPLLLIWRSGLLPPALEWLPLVPLVASAYGFSQSAAKTPDGYFRGFPSYWNVVAFYVYFLQPPAWVTATGLVGLALLTFVPAKYLYPSQRGSLGRLTIALGSVWGLMVLAVLLGVTPDERAWTLASAAFPAYYMIASWAITVHAWSKRRA